MRNMVEAERNLGNSSFYDYGLNIGQIVGDLAYMNPTDTEVWSDFKSSVVLGEDISYKVGSEYYNEVRVQASNVKSASAPRVGLSKERRAIDRLMMREPMLKQTDKDKPIQERLREIPALLNDKKMRDEEEEAMIELELAIMNM